MGTMGVEDVADELYGLWPGEFIATRNARAKELAGAGAPADAAEVRKLAKPSQSAWLANMLVREHPDTVDELLGLRRIAASPHDDARARMRALSERRRTLVADLVARAGAIARRAGHPMSVAAERELETTLEAAVADDSAADTIRRGRATVALTHVGFGDLDLSSAPPRPPSPRSGRAPWRDAKAKTRAEQRAVEKRQAALAVVDAADEAATQARARRDTARRQRRDAADQLQRAERDLERAESALARAEEARRKAQERLRADPP